MGFFAQCIIANGCMFTCALVIIIFRLSLAESLVLAVVMVIIMIHLLERFEGTPYELE